jgi:hypothetical protein
LLDEFAKTVEGSLYAEAGGDSLRALGHNIANSDNTRTGNVPNCR